MNYFEAIILGIVEGVTEFLPISSTGHLAIVEKMMGLPLNDSGVSAFTAIVQVGAVLATLIYFRADISRIVTAWVRGIIHSKTRDDPNYRFGWAIILGSTPIVIIGFAFKDQVETTLRSLWYVGFALVLWSAVMWVADRTATQQKREEAVTWKDTLIIGTTQCLALIPGVSRSGATMSAGLFRGFDRVTVTKLSFFLSIPALLGAGALQSVSEYDAISSGVGWGPTIVATLVSFVVAYISIAWLLKYIARHTYSIFIIYRVVVGLALLVLLATGSISAT